MTAQLKDPFTWTDCETTDLDVHKDTLVEIGVVTTDADLKIVDKGISVLTKPPAAALENINDFVGNMHTTSGLLDELEGDLSLGEATGQVLDYIRHFVPEQGKVLLAGSSVGTDKMFLEAYMSNVIDHLHYRTADASSVKELVKRWHRRAFENASVKHGGRRAFANTLRSIQELEYYRRVLFPVEPVTRAQVRAALEDALALKIPATGEDE